MHSRKSLFPILILLGLLDLSLSSGVTGELASTNGLEDDVCLLQDKTIIKSRKQMQREAHNVKSIHRNRSIHEINQVASSNRVCLSCATALDFDKHRVLDWIAYHNLQGIDCFLLFLDVDKSDLNDSLALDVYKKLTSSSMVTIINGTYDHQYGESTTRIGESITLSEARSILPKDVAYLALIDTDEYLVVDRPQAASTNSVASYQIPQMLWNRIGSKSKMGVYLNRWTYGSSGWTDLPPYELAPEFAYFIARASEPHPNRKMIINFLLAVEHDVQLGGWGGQHDVLHKADDPEMVSASDAFLSINHYMVASLKECMLKASEGSHHRGDREADCNGTLYSEVKDAILVKWKEPTRERRAMLFP